MLITKGPNAHRYLTRSIPTRPASITYRQQRTWAELTIKKHVLNFTYKLNNKIRHYYSLQIIILMITNTTYNHN